MKHIYVLISVVNTNFNKDAPPTSHGSLSAVVFPANNHSKHPVLVHSNIAFNIPNPTSHAYAAYVLLHEFFKWVELESPYKPRDIVLHISSTNHNINLSLGKICKTFTLLNSFWTTKKKFFERKAALGELESDMRTYLQKVITGGEYTPSDLMRETQTDMLLQTLNMTKRLRSIDLWKMDLTKNSAPHPLKTLIKEQTATLIRSSGTSFLMRQYKAQKRALTKGELK